MSLFAKHGLPVLAASVVLLSCISPSADAADALKTCICLVKECRTEFARCLGDVNCAANIACLQSCNGRPDETECQIKCGDLFANSVVDEFNTCAVSKKGCVPQKQDDNMYPIPPDSAIVQEFKPSQFTGKWFISSGLNTTFDTFDCQQHEFESDSPDSMKVHLAWRIGTPDGGFFTRRTEQSFVQDKQKKGLLLNHGNEFLHYQDDWYILDAQTDGKPDDFVFVYYRGTNDAWDGYGGAVIYTRAKTVPETILPRLRMAAAKVNLNFDKQFTATDNTCGPERPLLERLESTAERVIEKGEEAVLEEIKVVEEELELIGKEESKLFEELGKGLQEIEMDEKRLVEKLLTKEEQEFVDSLDMSPSEIGSLFKDAIPLRKAK